MKQHSHYIKVLFFVFVLIIKTYSLHAQFPDPPVPIAITANWTLEKNQANSNFGYSVASAGDVNGDGFDDVIVGAPFYDNGQTDEGAAFLYYGSAAGIAGTPAWMAQSNQIGAQLGFSVSSAGDVNNDGFSDVVIGAPFYDNGQINEGKAYVYLGSASGLINVPVWVSESDSAGALFGYNVANAGDVNGDDYGDVIVSALSYDILDGCCYEINNAGMVFIFHGNATGVSSTPNSLLFLYENETAYGVDVASAGDVNGDGFDDVLVGSNTWWDAPGATFLYYGSSTGVPNAYGWSDSGPEEDYFGTSVSSAGDVNGDGYDDVVISGPGGGGWVGSMYDVYIYHGGPSGLSETINWAIKGDQDWTDYGNSVSSGDFNNDGYDDIIIGASSFMHGETDEGVAYIFTGSSSGIPGATAWVAEANQANAHFGFTVAGAGDVNGDGYDDMIVSAPYFDNGQTDEGQVRIYLGNAGCVTPPDVTLDFTDNVCHDDGVITLTEGSPAGGTYTGSGIIGTNQFDPALAGIGTHTITYTYIAAGGCSATATDNLVVSGNPSANTTLGSASLNLCTSNPVVLVANAGTGLTYQWYKNGIALPGEIYLAYLAYATGNYQVQTTNVDGCSKMSKKKKVTHSGCRMEGEIAEELFSIYPNPNNGEFNFQFQSSELINGDVDIFITDMSGRLINQSVFQSMDGMVIGNINTNLPTGIYILKIVQDGINQTGNFIVN